jgi:RNA polymerase sigma-70 factor (ECF subfamily)
MSVAAPSSASLSAPRPGAKAYGRRGTDETSYDGASHGVAAHGSAQQSGGGMAERNEWTTSAQQLPDSSLGGHTVKRRHLDTDALATELFSAHYGRLAGWARKLLDDDDTAHEIAMEAFTRLLGKLRKVDDPVGYLYVIAANLVRDHWRKTRREREVVRLAKQASAQEATVSSGAGEADLRSLVESLPDRLRITVLLYYYAGFPLADVARLTDRPIGTVKSDLFQARAVLRQALDGTR